MKKTYFRELGAALLLFICFLAYQEKDKTLEILVTPFTTFAIAAFAGKHVSVGLREGTLGSPNGAGGSKRSSEHSSGEGE